MIAIDVFKPAQREWASPIVIGQKKTARSVSVSIVEIWRQRQCSTRNHHLEKRNVTNQ